MDISYARQLAESLLHTHGLDDWVIEFGYAKKQFGVCFRQKKIIRLSAPLVRLNSVERVTNTILHEIAHALTTGGYTPQWRETARASGCDGERCYSRATTRVPLRPWVGHCPQCGQTVLRHRRAQISCARCDQQYNPAYHLIWTKLTDSPDEPPWGGCG
jgi:predicted SprT family Zn-dependent metalloprotease